MRILAVLLALALALPARAELANEDYAWPNITDFVRQLIEKVGAPVRIYKIELDSDGKVDLWLQTRERPDLIDSYEYDHGAVGGPTPIKFDHYPTQAALDYHVIELTQIDFSRLPAMLARARKDLKLPQADVSFIKLERGDSSGFLSYTNIPIWTFNLTDPRHDGSVEFDLTGKVLNVDKD
jgi:hypothetical protein